MFPDEGPMICPFCEFAGRRREMHAHLAERHPDAVATRSTEEGRLFFGIRCPRCDFALEREVNPRGRDPQFLDTHRREVALVALDLLLHHLVAEHEVAPEA
jgi:hypothetical protein